MSDEDAVLVLVRDLMFSSRIMDAARTAGVTAKVIRNVAQLEGQNARKIFLDLNQDGALEAAVNWKNATGGQLIGFVSHVDTDTIEKAKQAGVDQIFTRGTFVQVLPDLIKG
jgi:AmiR/NasT family two-component response regulator